MNCIFCGEWFATTGSDTICTACERAINRLNLGMPPDCLNEFAQAYREGRVKILPKVEKGTCGSCQHFNRTPGTRSGTCSEREWYTDRYGHIDRHRGVFRPTQSRKSCKLYIARDETEAALKGGDER